MAEEHTYGHKDIQRYLQQKMSAQEMHHFEKALMNDPFLADALEGFSAGNDALTQQHLASIKRSVSGDHQKAKVVYLAVQRSRWLKVASVIIAIACAGAGTYYVLQRNGANKNGNLVVAPTSAPAPGGSVGTTDKPLADMRVQKKPPPGIHKFALPPLSPTAVVPNRSQNHPPATNNSIDTAQNQYTAANTLAESQKAEMNALKTKQSRDAVTNNGQQEFTGKFSDTSGAPLASASIAARRTLRKTTTDNEGPFTYKPPDSVSAGVTGNSSYHREVSGIKSSINEKKVSQKEDSLSLAEVVVSTMAKRRKTSVTIHTDSSVAAAPVVGWYRFEQYLNQQFDSLKAKELIDLDEEITVEFAIDQAGRPTNIVLPNALDKSVTENMTRILTNGPAWQSRLKDKKVKFVISL